MFIPKLIMDNNGYYDESFQISCDWEICIRYLQKKIEFKKVSDDILVDYATEKLRERNQILTVTERQNKSVLFVESVQNAKQNFTVSLHFTVTQRPDFLYKLSNSLLNYSRFCVEHQLEILIGSSLSLTLL